MPKVQYAPIVLAVRGKVGEQVLLQLNGKSVARAAPRYKYPFQPNQTVGQSRMKAAALAYSALTPEQAAAWQRYAEAQTERDPISGATFHPSAQNLFVGFAMKLLQLDPAAVLPVLPPSDSFSGDSLIVTVTGGAGTLLYTATAPNAAAIRTELLYQPLKSAVRKPQAFYKSGGFAQFVPGGLSHAVPVAPGWYACAYRFVQAQTGQTSLLLPLGVVQIM